MESKSRPQHPEASQHEQSFEVPEAALVHESLDDYTERMKHNLTQLYAASAELAKEREQQDDSALRISEQYGREHFAELTFELPHVAALSIRDGALRLVSVVDQKTNPNKAKGKPLTQHPSKKFEEMQDHYLKLKGLVEEFVTNRGVDGLTYMRESFDELDVVETIRGEPVYSNEQIAFARELVDKCATRKVEELAEEGHTGEFVILGDTPPSDFQ